MKPSHVVGKTFLVVLILTGRDPHLGLPVRPRKPVLIRSWGVFPLLTGGAFFFPLPFSGLHFQTPSRRCMAQLTLSPISSPPLRSLISAGLPSSLSLPGLSSPPSSRPLSLLLGLSPSPLPFPPLSVAPFPRSSRPAPSSALSSQPPRPLL